MRKSLRNLVLVGTLGLAFCSCRDSENKNSTSPSMDSQPFIYNIGEFEMKEKVYEVADYPEDGLYTQFFDAGNAMYWGAAGDGVLDYVRVLTGSRSHTGLISRKHPSFPKYEDKFEEIKMVEASHIQGQHTKLSK